MSNRLEKKKKKQKKHRSAGRGHLSCTYISTVRVYRIIIIAYCCVHRAPRLSINFRGRVIASNFRLFFRLRVPLHIGIILSKTH